MRDRSRRPSGLTVLVATVCGCAVLVGVGSVWIALSARTSSPTPTTAPVPTDAVCVSDPERPNGADGCEQDPMVVCMSDQYYAGQVTDAETKRALLAEAAVYCAEAIDNVDR